MLFLFVVFISKYAHIIYWFCHRFRAFFLDKFFYFESVFFSSLSHVLVHLTIGFGANVLTFGRWVDRLVTGACKYAKCFVMLLQIENRHGMPFLGCLVVIFHGIACSYCIAAACACVFVFVTYVTVCIIEMPNQYTDTVRE